MPIIETVDLSWVSSITTLNYYEWNQCILRKYFEKHVALYDEKICFFSGYILLFSASIVYSTNKLDVEGWIKCNHPVSISPCFPTEAGKAS